VTSASGVGRLRVEQQLWLAGADHLRRAAGIGMRRRMRKQPFSSRCGDARIGDLDHHTGDRITVDEIDDRRVGETRDRELSGAA